MQPLNDLRGLALSADGNANCPGDLAEIIEPKLSPNPFAIVPVVQADAVSIWQHFVQFERGRRCHKQCARPIPQQVA
jgi:hypothetical protein